MPNNQTFEANTIETTARNAVPAEDGSEERPARLDIVCKDDAGNVLTIRVPLAAFDKENERHIERLLGDRLSAVYDRFKKFSENMDDIKASMKEGVSSFVTDVRKGVGFKTPRTRTPETPGTGASEGDAVPASETPPADATEPAQEPPAEAAPEPEAQPTTEEPVAAGGRGNRNRRAH